MMQHSRSSRSTSIQMTIVHAVLNMTPTDVTYFSRLVTDMAREIVRRFPIVLLNQGKLYAQQLVDVTGNTIRSPETGRPLNIFQDEMARLIENGDIRLIHKVTPGYVYIVTNSYDEQMFKHERDHGSEFPHTEYSVYFDEDFTMPRYSAWAYYRERQ